MKLLPPAAAATTTTPDNNTVTEYGQQTDEDDGQGAHAQPQDLLLLHELAVGPGEARPAEAVVPLGRLPVDAGAAVVAGVVEALVAVHARLAVGGHALAAGAAGLVRGGERLVGSEDLECVRMHGEHIKYEQALD